MHLQPRFLAPILTLAACASLVGCTGTQQRGLRISEVGKRNVELYFDEAAGRSLTTGGSHRLTVTTHNGTFETVDLGLLRAPLQAGEFVVIWGASGYQGPPVAEDYSGGQTGSVTGIKVRRDFFGDVDTQPAEIRLTGDRNRASAILVIVPQFTRDVLDDVVRFGAPVGDRPASGGSFVSDGSLGNPAGSTSLQRYWRSSGPLDTDQESDWGLQLFTTWGVRTP